MNFSRIIENFKLVSTVETPCGWVQTYACTFRMTGALEQICVKGTIEMLPSVSQLHCNFVPSMAERGRSASYMRPVGVAPLDPPRHVDIPPDPVAALYPLAVCECGVKHTGGLHSDWCPLAGLD